VFRYACVPVGLVVLALGPGVRAQADGASREALREPEPVEIGVTGFGRLDFVNKSGPLYAGVALAPRYRFSPLLSVGAFGAYAWKLGSDAIGNSAGSVELGFTNFRVEAEARLHPMGLGDVDLWLGADAGLSGRRRTTDGFDADGREIENRSDTELSPIGGLSLGVDFHGAEFLALGPEFRVAVLTIRNDPALALSLGLSGTLLFPAP
jgi:hypothetical protein